MLSPSCQCVYVFVRMHVLEGIVVETVPQPGCVGM